MSMSSITGVTVKASPIPKRTSAVRSSAPESACDDRPASASCAPAKEVPKEVVKYIEVEVPVEVIREVVKTVEIPVEVIVEKKVEKEVEKKVEVPVQIIRDANSFQSPSMPNLYPAGEGAGRVSRAPSNDPHE